MVWSLLVGSIITLAVVYWCQFGHSRSIHREGDKLRFAPGTLPILGNAVSFLRPRHILFDWFVQCQRAFGSESFRISIPFLPPGIVINDPRNLEYVLKNEGTITKGEFFRQRSWDLFGHGIINADGNLWRAQRRAGLKFFTGSNLDLLVEEVLPKSYLRTRSALAGHAGSGQLLDLEAVLLDLTTTVVGRMAYDMDIDASSPFSRAFDYASDQTGYRFQNPLYFLTEYFTGTKLRSSLHKVKIFGQQIVSGAQKRRSEQRGKSSASKSGLGSLIDSLMDAFDDDPILTADAALNFLSAGRDTTAQSLTWSFYSLFRNPSALSALRTEIDSTFHKKRLSDASENALTVADLQPANLPNTLSIFNEALRLHPPVPFEIKQCQADTTLPDGTFLPSGSIILWCIWAMNRAREIWGDDTDSFRPGRWLQRTDVTDGCKDDNTVKDTSKAADVKVITKSAFEFPVFNGGPRSCLGKKMAELIACWVLVNVWHEFDLEEAFDDVDRGKNEKDEGFRGPAGWRNKDRRERRSKNSLTLPMEGGLPCRVSRRKESVE